MTTIRVLLNYEVHLPITDKDLEGYLSTDENMVVATQDSFFTLAEMALRKELTDFNDKIVIDADYAIGSVDE